MRPYPTTVNLTKEEIEFELANSKSLFDERMREFKDLVANSESVVAFEFDEALRDVKRAENLYHSWLKDLETIESGGTVKNPYLVPEY